VRNSGKIERPERVVSPSVMHFDGGRSVESAEDAEPALPTGSSETSTAPV